MDERNLVGLFAALVRGAAWCRGLGGRLRRILRNECETRHGSGQSTTRARKPHGAVYTGPCASSSVIRCRAAAINFEYPDTAGAVADLTAELRRSLEAALALPVLAKKFPMPGSRAYTAALNQLSAGLNKDSQARWLAVFGWLFVRSLGKLADPENFPSVSRSWIDEWHLGSTLENAMHASGLTQGSAARSAGLIRLLTEQQVLDLEREAFLRLCGERKTLERIGHTLKTGKPLRN